MRLEPVDSGGSGVKLYVDLETFELIQGPGFRNPVSSLRFKRGDAAKLEVVFLRDGITPEAIGDPASLELRFGIKPRNRYDVGYLVHTADWTLPAPGAESPVYQCSPSFNTVELNSALNVGSATATELSEVTLMGEITWRQDGSEPTSTRTFLVIVENDVNRGEEGVPTEAQPAYPAPEHIASPADVAASMNAHLNAADPHPKYLRHDIEEALSATQRGYVRAAIQAAQAPPDLSMPMQNLAGEWHPAVLDFDPHNSRDLGWSAFIFGNNDASIRVSDPNGQHQDIQFTPPPAPNAGLMVISNGTTISIQPASNSWGHADTDYGGPNSLREVASAIEGLGYDLTVELTGYSNEPINGSAEPFANRFSEGTPGWRGRLAVLNGQAWICTKDDMTPSNDGWRKMQTVVAFPSQITDVLINSYENWTSFGAIELGRSYRVRFDNFGVIPVAGESFGIGFVNYGSATLFDIQPGASGFLDVVIDSNADVSMILSGTPSSPSDLFAEYTFTAGENFDWAGYCYYGSYGTGYEISFTVTLTPI